MSIRRTIVICLFLLILSIGIAYSQEACLKVIFIDVGQGDAALLKCDGEAMMIDTGMVSAWMHIKGGRQTSKNRSIKYV